MPCKADDCDGQVTQPTSLASSAAPLDSYAAESGGRATLGVSATAMCMHTHHDTASLAAHTKVTGGCTALVQKGRREADGRGIPTAPSSPSWARTLQRTYIAPPLYGPQGPPGTAVLGFGSANFDFEVDDGVPGPDFNSKGLVAGTVRA